MLVSPLLLMALACTPVVDVDDPQSGDLDADADTDTDTDSDTDSDTDADSDTDTVPVEVAVTGVSPDLGTNGGGQEVVISGDDLIGVDRVLFGTSDAIVLGTTAGTVSVETPETLREGLVSVTVSGPGITGTREDAFTFLPDRTGVDGGLGIHVYTRSTGYEAGDGDYGSSDVWLFDGFPVFDVHDYIGPVDDCLDQNPSGPVLTLTDLGVEAIGLASSDGGVVQLALESDGGFSHVLESTQEYGAGADWDVALAQGIWPAFTLHDAFTAGSATSFTTPVLGSGEPTISASETFEWTPRGGEWMYLHMNLYWRDWWESSYSLRESRRCLVQNSGTFAMGTAGWTAWPDHFWDSGTSR